MPGRQQIAPLDGWDDPTGVSQPDVRSSTKATCSTNRHLGSHLVRFNVPPMMLNGRDREELAERLATVEQQLADNDRDIMNQCDMINDMQVGPRLRQVGEVLALLRANRNELRSERSTLLRELYA